MQIISFYITLKSIYVSRFVCFYKKYVSALIKSKIHKFQENTNSLLSRVPSFVWEF